MNPTVAEASVLLGGTEGWVRSLCKRGLIGDAWSEKKNPERLTYVIVPGKLADYMMIDPHDLEERLTKLREDERRWNEFRENRRPYR